MNLPLYSPTAPAAGGSRGKDRRRFASTPRRRRRSAPGCRPPAFRQCERVQSAAFEEVALHRRVASRRFPIRPPWAAARRPSARTHRPRRSSRGRPACSGPPARMPSSVKVVPGAVTAFPVRRRLPSMCVDRVPAGGEPEFGPAVAAIFHEPRGIRRGHGMSRDGECPQPHPVTRRFVVESEAVALVPDVPQSRRIGDPSAHRGGGSGSAATGFWYSGFSGFRDEQVFQVGEDQLLVLLFMVQPKSIRSEPARRHGAPGAVRASRSRRAAGRRALPPATGATACRVRGRPCRSPIEL